MFKIGDFSRLSQVSVKTLRYYDEIGLLAPAHIDPATNYRYYAADQLPRLNRILALKDLGLSLDEIGDLLASDLSAEHMRDLLRRKRANLERELQREQARLARVEARLRQIEREGTPDYEIVVKRIPAQRTAAARGVMAHYGDLDPLFATMVRYLAKHNIDPAARYPWTLIYHDTGYCETNVDTSLAIPVDGALASSDGVTVEDHPPIEHMASVVHRGPYETIASAYTALMPWIEANRYIIVGPNRNVMLHGPDRSDDPTTFVTEIQFPVAPM